MKSEPIYSTLLKKFKKQETEQGGGSRHSSSTRSRLRLLDSSPLSRRQTSCQASKQRGPSILMWPQPMMARQRPARVKKKKPRKHSLPNEGGEKRSTIWVMKTHFATATLLTTWALWFLLWCYCLIHRVPRRPTDYHSQSDPVGGNLSPWHWASGRDTTPVPHLRLRVSSLHTPHE